MCSSKTQLIIDKVIEHLHYEKQNAGQALTMPSKVTGKSFHKSTNLKRVGTQITSGIPLLNRGPEFPPFEWEWQSNMRTAAPFKAFGTAKE